MTSLRLRATLALAAAAFTAACGGGDGSSGPSFADSVSTADAQDAGNNVAAYASQVAFAMNFGGPSIGIFAAPALTRVKSYLPSTPAVFAGRELPAVDLSALDLRHPAAVKGLMLADPSASCTYSGHGFTGGFGFDGDPIDVNGNGIPDDFAFRVECVESDSVAPDTTVTMRIVQDYAIKELTGSLYGGTIAVHVLARYSDNHGRYEEEKIDLTGKQDIRADGIIDQASLEVHQGANNNIDPVVAISAGESWDNRFDPASTISLGSDIPDGALTLNGKTWAASTITGLNLSFTVSTPTPLAYSAACADADTNPPFTAGVLHGKLNNSSNQASFQIDFTSCGNYDVTVNGAYDEVVVANHP
ncbi:MAG TPA: hypothetical protein VG940_05920 [Gemmatimonadales bacterium]|nr:hypothetical protein [Gemmatimonadales bacterium]